MKKSRVNHAFAAKLRAQRFVDAYCGKCLFDGPAAAKAAGYKGTAKSLSVQACRFLRREDVAVAIRERLRVAYNQGVADAEECLTRLSAHVRGDMGDFIRVDEKNGCAVIDLEAARRANKLGLIKKLRKHSRKGVDAFGNPYEIVSISIELHDAQKACELLLRVGNIRGFNTPPAPDPRTLDEKRRRVMECYLKANKPLEEWLPSVRAFYEREQANGNGATAQKS